MTGPRHLKRLSTTVVTAPDSIPDALRQPLVLALQSWVDPDDFEEQLEEWLDEGLERVTFTLETLAPENLDHPLLPQLLDPEAEEFIIIEVGGEATEWFMIIAQGGNPMGFVFDPEGRRRLDIYDGGVQASDQEADTQDPDIARALQVLYVWAEDEQSVIDTKEVVLQRWGEDYASFYSGS